MIFPKRTVLLFSSLLLCALPLKTHASSIRGSSEEIGFVSDDVNCKGFKTSDSCSSPSCAWCESAAVHSACYPASDADKLPPGIFSCTTNSEDESEPLPGHSFSFVEGLQHNLSDAPVDGDFCDPSSLSFSGYMSVTGSRYDRKDEDKNLFFWFFEKRTSAAASPEEEEIDPDTIPFVVWLTGGPGCSSTLALLAENGPCTVNEAGDGTEINPHSWTESAHMLWLDQPAGVGYSYGEETDKNEKMVGEDGYYFLQSFFQAHPEYAKNPLIIVGESYGGHYAPAIAHRVLIGNKRKRKGTVVLNLGGLAVGNGLTNPEIQYQYYAEMAYHNSHGIKTVSEKTYHRMTRKIPECVKLIEQCDGARTFVTDEFFCQEAMNICNVGQTSPYMMTGLNPYDIRIPCGDHPLCYDFSNIERFLDLESTREALHVSDRAHKKWNACNMNVHQKFTFDWMSDLSPDVAGLLNANVHVLIYAGDADFICNYLGNKAWTMEMEWKQKEEFAAAEDKEWNGDGLARSTKDGLFTFMQVYDAGHMVPSDQPEAALRMITNFMEGGGF